MRPGPAAAVTLLTTVLTIESPPRRARDWLGDIALSEGWTTLPPEALELAERWEQAFIRRLRREQSSLMEIGRPCPYTFNSSSEDLIQGAAFIEDGVDDEAVKEAKRRRAFAERYGAALRVLTPTQFEWLCLGILEELGVVEIHLTAYSGDEGIDFYGRLRLEGRLRVVCAFPGVERRLVVWMVGQAKHYQATQVATPDIRELVGAVTLGRARAFGGPKSAKYQDLNIAVCDPVFYLFFTTGRISADGWRLLLRSGVIAMDGEMVAAFLAEQGVGLDENQRYDEARFIGWVNAHGGGRT